MDQTWSTDHVVAVQGWVVGDQVPIERLEVSIDDRFVEVTSWHERPDLAPAFPGRVLPERPGFWVQIPRTARHHVALRAHGGGRTWKTNHLALGRTPPDADRAPPAPGESPHHPLFRRFIERVNEERRTVLEVGSRVVSPGSASKRDLFPGAASFVGFDYHPDANTDVVGDAHQLSTYFGSRTFGAIYSLSVLEHIAMPWILAREISRVLEIGGLTFHWTSFAWPLHDPPCDYWRFSSDALKMLFPPALGFEVIDAVMEDPVHLYMDSIRPGFESFPTCPGFASTGILAVKRSEPDLERLRWEMSPADVLGDAASYPTDQSNSQTARSPAA